MEQIDARDILRKTKYSLFSPKSKRGLSIDYKELYKIESFKRLGKEEQLFVWYFRL